MVTITTNATDTNPRWSQQTGWLLITVVIAVAMACLRMAMTAPFKLASFERLVQFQSVEPFQHRVLTPAIAAGIQQLLPLGDVLVFGILDALMWIALIVLAYRALVLFNIGRRDSSRWLLALTVLIPVALHLILPDFGLALSGPDQDSLFATHALDARPLFYYVYDLPAAVFTLAMVLLLAHQARDREDMPTIGSFLPYLGLFALATVNRETTVFMLPLFALMFWQKLTFSRWFWLLVLQCLVFVAIQYPLHWLFRGHINPSASLAGSQYENHIQENIGLLSRPVYLLAFSLRFAGALYLPIVLWWRHVDWRLASAIAGFGLPLIALAMLAGRIQEHRLFIEVVPLIWIGAVQTIATRRLAVRADKPSGSSSPPPAAHAA